MGYDDIVHEILENEIAHHITLSLQCRKTLYLYLPAGKKKKPTVLKSAGKEVTFKKSRQKFYSLA